MSEFNIFAKRLDEAFRKSCSEYNAAFHALECAQQASRDANAWRLGDSAEEKQVRTARAALKLHDAEATFNEVSARVWDNFKATRHTIRAELEQAVRTADIVNPDAINNNALELMKSGVMTSDDYAAFVKKYGNNPTMLRLFLTPAKVGKARLYRSLMIFRTIAATSPVAKNRTKFPA